MDSLPLRAREGRRLMVISLIVNAVLALAKILGGIFGRSHALIADGVESLLDVLSSTLMWWAIRYAEKPPDNEHPYGHGKMESLAAVLGSLLLLGAGLSLGVHSLREIIFQDTVGPEELPAGFTLVILFVTIVTKELLFRWLDYRGRVIGSKAVQTDAMHHRSDAMTSLAAGIGITAALIGGPKWAAADDWAALFSCLLIVFNGFRMLRGSVGEILDEQIPSVQIEEILAIARSVEGVTSVEKCRVRKSGLGRIADLHVRVPGAASVQEGHDVAHAVQARLMASEFDLMDVTVHIEPEAQTT